MDGGPRDRGAQAPRVRRVRGIGGQRAERVPEQTAQPVPGGARAAQERDQERVRQFQQRQAEGLLGRREDRRKRRIDEGVPVGKGRQRDRQAREPELGRPGRLRVPGQFGANLRDQPGPFRRAGLRAAEAVLADPVEPQSLPAASRTGVASCPPLRACAAIVASMNRSSVALEPRCSHWSPTIPRIVTARARELAARQPASKSDRSVVVLQPGSSAATRPTAREAPGRSQGARPSSR